MKRPREEGVVPHRHSKAARSTVSCVSAMDRARLRDGVRTQFVLSPLLSYVPELVRAATGDDVVKDEKTLALAGEVFRSGPRHLVTDAALSEKADMPTRRVMDDRIKGLCAMMLLSDQCEMVDFQKCLAAAPSVRKVLYVEYCRFDETPMSMRLREKIEHVGAISRAASGATSIGHAEDKTLGDPHVVGALTTSTCPTKLFQTEVSHGMLLSFPGETGEQWVMLFAKGLASLQALDSTNAITLREALERSSQVNLGSQMFEEKMRASTSDKASSNRKADRAVTIERGQGWSGLSFDCEVHIVATAHKHCFKLLTNAITGTINLALALQMGGAMARFRRILVAELLKPGKLVVLVGRASAEAERFRANILRVFGGRSRLALPRLVGLATYLNGDWRDHDAVQVYVDALPLDIESFKRQRATAIAWVLAGRRPSTFPRHRWRGAAESCDDLGLMCAAHNLLDTVFPKFCASFGTTRSKPIETSGTTPRSASGSWAAVGVAGILAIADAEEPPLASAMPSESREAESLNGQPPAEAHWQHEAVLHRQLALRFVQEQEGGCLATMLALRLQLEPLRALLHKQIVLSSDKWERNQRRLVASLWQPSPGAHADLAGRPYKVVLGALGLLERSYMKHLKVLQNQSELWNLVPEDAMTEGFNCAQFSLLARQGALIHELLATPHASYPFRMFLLVADATMAEALAQDRHCIMDAWSRRFVQTNDLLSEEARQKLTLLSTMISVDIVRIECLHASIRRLLEARSLQTHRCELERLSAEWVAMQFRQRPCTAGQHRTSTTADGPMQDSSLTDPGSPGPSAVSKARRGGGGTWRAFVSESDIGRQRDFKALRGRYWALRDAGGEELERLHELGKQATVAHRAGAARAFGPRQRDVARDLAQRGHLACAKVAAEVADEGEQVHALADHIIRTEDIAEARVKSARKQAPPSEGV